MNLLQQLPDELQRIVVSYSRPKYPYLKEIKNLPKKVFMDNFEKYVKKCSYLKLSRHQGEMVFVYGLCDERGIIKPTMNEIDEFNYYPWNKKIILEECVPKRNGKFTGFMILDWMKWTINDEMMEKRERAEPGEYDFDYNDDYTTYYGEE
jgi:uncharacterized membrane protein